MASYFDNYTLDDLLDEMEAVYLNDKKTLNMAIVAARIVVVPYR